MKPIKLSWQMCLNSNKILNRKLSKRATLKEIKLILEFYKLYNNKSNSKKWNYLITKTLIIKNGM